MTTPIVETITYRTKDGVSDAQYLAAARGLDDFIARCGGMIARSIHKDDDGLWHETMIWTSRAAYEAANQQFMTSAEGQAVVGHISPETLTMQAFDALHSRAPRPEAA